MPRKKSEPKKELKVEKKKATRKKTQRRTTTKLKAPASIPELEIEVKRKKKVKMDFLMKPNFIRDDVPNSMSFFVHDGTRLYNLLQLADHLEKMSDDSFSRHVNGDKNDFANWVRDVMKEKELAENFDGKDRIGMQIEVLKYIVYNGR